MLAKLMPFPFAFKKKSPPAPRFSFIGFPSVSYILAYSPLTGGAVCVLKYFNYISYIRLLAVFGCSVRCGRFFYLFDHLFLASRHWMELAADTIQSTAARPLALATVATIGVVDCSLLRADALMVSGPVLALAAKGFRQGVR